jgi:uncharacterized membrane protein
MAQELVYERGGEDAKQFARIMYIAHAVALVFSAGTLSLLILIANYVKRPDTAGTIVYSHHTWMIRTFWFGLLWAVVGLALWFTIVLPFVVWGVTWLWMVYRVFRGFVDLNNNRPMPV